MKISKLFLFAACCGLVFSSCTKEGCTDETAANYDSEAKEDDGSCKYDQGPAIDVFTVMGDAYLGDTIGLHIEVSDADSTLSEIEIYEAVNGGAEALIHTETISGYMATYHHNYLIENKAEGDVITFRVVAKDIGVVENGSIEMSKDVTVMVRTTFDYENTDAFFHIGGSLQGAFNLADNMAMSSSDDDAKKDMVNTDMAGNTFTGSWTIGTGNTTTYVEGSNFDYAASYDDAVSYFDGGTAITSIDNPSEGDIYLAKLRGTDYAVIMITEVDPTNNDCNCGNTGKITFKYKKVSETAGQ